MLTVVPRTWNNYSAQHGCLLAPHSVLPQEVSPVKVPPIKRRPSPQTGASGDANYKSTLPLPAIDKRMLAV
jgi:hypothetical protein